jgi:glycosyltransferase involved in cell wall biosynthesis
MSNNLNKIIIWWEIPCKAITPVLEELSKLQNTPVMLVTSALSVERKNMGWVEPLLKDLDHIILSESEWQHRAKEILLENKNAFHIFNGFYFPKYISNLESVALKFSIRYAILSEAPSNRYNFVKWYIAEFYHRCILPIRTKKVLKNALFVGSLSGSSIADNQKFYRLGVPKESLIPFGYFSKTENPPDYNLNNNLIPQIFCPGNLVRHKGVHLLIKALNVLDKLGLDFSCHITGSGPELSRLKKMTAKFSLDNKIVFHGVLEQFNYDCLKNKMDILVAPGYIEPWGIRINESIQVGHVVILSDKIGAAELIKSSGGGEIFKSGDYIDLSKKLKTYLEKHDNILIAKAKNMKYSSKISPESTARYLNLVIQSKLNNQEVEKPNWL